MDEMAELFDSRLWGVCVHTSSAGTGGQLITGELPPFSGCGRPDLHPGGFQRREGCAVQPEGLSSVQPPTFGRRRCTAGSWATRRPQPPPPSSGTVIGGGLTG